MFANKYYDRDIENAFAISRFFFRVIGIWPLTGANSLFLELLETVTLIAVCFIFLLYEVIPAMLYTFIILTDIHLKLKVVGSMIFSIVEIIKYVYMVLYKTQVRNCLMLVDKDWQDVVKMDDRTSMIDKMKIGKRLIVLCAVFVYLTFVATRIIMPLSMGKIVTPQNVTIRPLPIVAYLVVLDVQRTPVYEIVYFLQFLAGFVKYTILVATFSFVTLCVMHFCAQSNILMTLMNDFVNENQPENLNRKLAILVEHQIKIKK